MGQIFTEAELGRLVEAFVLPLPEGSEITEETVLQWVKWCEKVQVAASLVEGTIRGHFRPTWPTGAEEPVFCRTARPA